MYTMMIQRTSWATIALLTLLVGCKKSTDPVTAANSACQLQSAASMTNGSSDATIYTYNSNGQLIKTVAASKSATPTTYTYAYDAAGNVTSALTQGTLVNTNFTSTGSYEYTNGRITKITAQSSSTALASTTDSYTYDGSGQMATYSFSSSDSNYGSESYSFTNGILAAGTITRGGQSLTLTVANGRVTSITYPSGRQDRFTYDANGYVTRADYLDGAGGLQSYTVFAYNPVSFKQVSTPSLALPTLEMYGSKGLPLLRVGVYSADGSLKAETLYQYEGNSKGYLISSGFTQNQPGVGGQTTSATTYTYSNCQ